MYNAFEVDLISEAKSVKICPLFADVETPHLSIPYFKFVPHLIIPVPRLTTVAIQSCKIMRGRKRWI